MGECRQLVFAEYLLVSILDFNVLENLSYNLNFKRMTATQTVNRDIAISGLAMLVAYYFTSADWILMPGAGYLVLCLLIPWVKRMNHTLWLAITKGMQTVMNPLLFGVIFLGVLTPLALLFRLFRKKTPPRTTTFSEVNQTFDAAFFEVPW